MGHVLAKSLAGTDRRVGVWTDESIGDVCFAPAAWPPAPQRLARRSKFERHVSGGAACEQSKQRPPRAFDLKMISTI